MTSHHTPPTQYRAGRAQLEAPPEQLAIEAGPTGTGLIPRVCDEPHTGRQTGTIRLARTRRPAPPARVAAAPPKPRPKPHVCRCRTEPWVVILAVLAGACGAISILSLVVVLTGG